MDLARFTSFYRRDSDEVLGAVRLSAVETLTMEQMPGGRFQIIARTTAGGDGFVSCVMGTLSEGQGMLELMRRYVGGETDVNPAETYIAKREADRSAVEAEHAAHALRLAEETATSAVDQGPDWSPPRS